MWNKGKKRKRRKEKERNEKMDKENTEIWGERKKRKKQKTKSEKRDIRLEYMTGSVDRHHAVCLPVIFRFICRFVKGDMIGHNDHEARQYDKKKGTEI